MEGHACLMHWERSCREQAVLGCQVAACCESAVQLCLPALPAGLSACPPACWAHASPLSTSPPVQGAASAKRAAMSEEDLFDDEDSAVQAEYEAMRYVLSSMPTFSSAQAGAHDAATIVLGAVVDLHAEPSPADLQALAAFVRGAGDVAAAVLVVAALDSLAAAGLGGAAAGLRQDLAAWCSEHEVDVEAAVDSVLHKDKVDDPLLQEIEGQLADLLGDEVPVPV